MSGIIRKLVVCIVFALAVIASSSAKSAIIDVDLDTGHSGFQIEGDDLLWVDMSYSNGMNYTEAQEWASDFGYAIATRDQVADLFDAIDATNGYMDIYEKNHMGAYVVSGYASARGFFDDRTAAPAIGEADYTYQSWFIDDDAKDAGYSADRFGTFIVQPVPEPLSGLLLALGGLVLSGCRRRRRA